MMKTSNKGIELIKSHEGLRLKAYVDAAGIWTIGYGHTGGVKSGDVISEWQANNFLLSDLKTAERAVNTRLKSLAQNQFDALVSLVYNIGEGNFQRSTLLRLARSNPRNPAIRTEFARWVYAGGKVLPGLVKRRKDEADLYFS